MDTHKIKTNLAVIKQLATECETLLADTPPVPPVVVPTTLAIWANDGSDKVTRQQTRKLSGADVRNYIWDGTTIRLTSARHETVACTLILETGVTPVSSISVTSSIGELFYVRYLKVDGMSSMGYTTSYDERHAPKRMRLPCDPNTGEVKSADKVWSKRPDADHDYPDICVPMRLHKEFNIAAKSSQMIWLDVFSPLGALPGVYKHAITVRENGVVVANVSIELTVLNLGLPKYTTSGAFAFIETAEVNRAHLGATNKWPHDDNSSAGVETQKKSRAICDKYVQMLHAHGVATITENTPANLFDQKGWPDRLTGALFTPERGHTGPWRGQPNGVFSIGTYGRLDSATIVRESSLQAGEVRKHDPFCEVFVYVADEPAPGSAGESVAGQLADTLRAANSNTSGGAAKSFCTMRPTPVAEKFDIVCLPTTEGVTSVWQTAIHKLRGLKRKIWSYNGHRPQTGTQLLEDDGAGMVMLAWTQWKMGIERWFVWSACGYTSEHRGWAATNVFATCATFGGATHSDASLGQTGYLRNNSDGVLLYPGRNLDFPTNSGSQISNYGVDEPFASIRLKLWRRGLQDFEYLRMAHGVDSVRTAVVVNKVVPRVHWDVGVANADDPTYVYTDISWPADPDVWAAARKQLVDVIIKR